MKVFLSYSWDDEPHKDWVRRFADQLQRNGLEIILDQYDLKPGDDRFKFMESSVRAADCVLIICTPDYTDRANQRAKGVGVETSLITPQFYERAKGNKQFIPIIRRIRDDVPHTPDYLAALIFVDFRDDSKFDANFEELLRHLYRQPKHSKPPLGSVPKFTTTPISASDPVATAAQSPAGSRMSVSDIVSQVLGSSKGDWTFFEEKGLYVCKLNPDITIVCSEVNYNSDTFHEGWVAKFPDPVAYRETFEIRYRNTPVEERILVSVDGHRMQIPLPKSAVDLHISADQYRFGRLINEFQPWGRDFDDYLQRAGISVRG